MNFSMGVIESLKGWDRKLHMNWTSLMPFLFIYFTEEKISVLELGVSMNFS